MTGALELMRISADPEKAGKVEVEPEAVVLGGIRVARRPVVR